MLSENSIFLEVHKFSSVQSYSFVPSHRHAVQVHLELHFTRHADGHDQWQVIAQTKLDFPISVIHVWHNFSKSGTRPLAFPSELVYETEWMLPKAKAGVHKIVKVRAPICRSGMFLPKQKPKSTNDKVYCSCFYYWNQHCREPTEENRNLTIFETNHEDSVAARSSDAQRHSPAYASCIKNNNWIKN